MTAGGCEFKTSFRLNCGTTGSGLWELRDIGFPELGNRDGTMVLYLGFRTYCSRTMQWPAEVSIRKFKLSKKIKVIKYFKVSKHIL
jgi:hypothetical protein